MAKWQQSIALAFTLGVGGVGGCDSEDDDEDMIGGTDTDAADETFGEDDSTRPSDAEDDGEDGPDEGPDEADDGDWKGAGTSTNGTDDEGDGESESGGEEPDFRR